MTAALPGMAQDLPDGGRQFTFGLILGLDTNDNLDLTPVSPGTTNQVTAGLSFGALTQTENMLFRLDIGWNLQWNDGPNFPDSGLDYSLPDVALLWQHDARNSSIEVEADYVVTALDDLRPVDDFDTGTGMRADTDLALAYTWGTAGPFQIGVDAAYSTSDYFDDPSPDLIDNQNTVIGLNLGFDINPVTDLSFGVSRSVYEETQRSFDPEVTWGYTVDLSIDRPRGPVTGSVFYDDTWEGDRYGFSVGQDSALRGGSLDYAIGATHTAVAEEIVMTGSLDYQYDLPDGSITAAAFRVVDYDSDNQESVTSGLSLSWTRQVTPLGSLNLSFSAASQDVLITNDTSRNAQAQVMWTQEFMQDWAMDLGAIYAQSEETGLKTATSREVFLNLRKEFAIRP